MSVNKKVCKRLDFMQPGLCCVCQILCDRAFLSENRKLIDASFKAFVLQN